MHFNRKYYLLLLCCFWLTTILQAQNYSTILPNEIHLFEPIEDLTIRDLEPGKYVRGIKTDSLSVEGLDTIIWFQKEMVCDDNLNPYDSYCYVGPSWLGSKVILKSNGDNIFFNYHGDSILIKTRAVQNEKWILWLGDDGSYIEAEITGILLESFLEIQDSVKSITIKHYASDGSVIDNFGGFSQIRLSKSYGLLAVYNFRDFPSNQRNEQIVIHELAGCSKDKVGLHILTLGEVYDYEIGDEFHVGTYSEISQRDEYSTLKVLDKWFSTSEDTLFYEIEKNYWRIINPSSVYTRTYVSVFTNLDSSMAYVPFSERTDTIIPFEVTKIFEGLHISGYVFFSGSIFNNRYQIKSSEENFALSYQERYIFTGEVLESGYARNNYLAIKGCGFYKYTELYEGYIPLLTHREELHYFKKGEETWGIPLSSNDELIASSRINIQIWPNPASTQVHIKINSSISELETKYKIINPIGKHCLSGTLKTNSPEKIDISNLDPGIYFIYCEFPFPIFSKFIKQ